MRASSRSTTRGRRRRPSSLTSPPSASPVPTGPCERVARARLGNSVRCFDQDRDRIEALRAGEMPFAEPGLAELVKDGVDAGRLAFVTGLAAACRQAAAVVVAVGTDEDGRWSDRHIRGVL